MCYKWVNPKGNSVLKPSFEIPLFKMICLLKLSQQFLGKIFHSPIKNSILKTAFSSFRKGEKLFGLFKLGLNLTGCISCLCKQLPQKVFCKKSLLKSFAKFIEKHLWWSLFFNEVGGWRLKNRLQHRYFSVNLREIF